ILAYLLLTAAEILISITGLEFAYTQAPKKMKSVVMSLWLVSVSVGNLVASGVNFIIIKPDGTSKLAGANYYWFFVGMMLVTAVVFIFIARGYKEKHYIQGSEDAPSAEGEPIPEA
ncbi:MAG: MFS transporter, partial [Phycisphaerae bacterium]|nr:MFS transporter [Phycisphaerae bacterium]